METKRSVKRSVKRVRLNEAVMHLFCKNEAIARLERCIEAVCADDVPGHAGLAAQYVGMGLLMGVARADDGGLVRDLENIRHMG